LIDLRDMRSKLDSTKPRIAAVIPAFNEAGRVGRVLEAIPVEWVDDIIVVDDHSGDSTVEESLREGATQIVHCQSHGVGAAIKAGYREALKGSAGLIVVLAGDGQHDPHEIQRIITPVLQDKADYVVGDRLGKSAPLNPMPPVRRVGNRILTMLTRLITGFDIRDAQCGFTAVSRKTLSELDLQWVSDSWGIPNDILVECARLGKRVQYVPVRALPSNRRSYIRLHSYLPRIIFVLLRGSLRMARSRFRQ
jgi:glycosyltransferase involved in cell wall biosynthesis